MTRAVFRGFASRHVAARLAGRDALRGARVALPGAVREAVPDLPVLLDELGCTVEPRAGDELALMLGTLGVPGVRVVISAATSSAGGELALSSLHGFALVARRRACDYLVWRRLFDEQSAIALAGQRLVIDRYCDVGRVIAHRARGMGMLVEIHDPEPARRLEARCDGFDTAPAGPGGGASTGAEQALAVRIDEVLAQSHAAGAAGLAGIEDEAGATCLIALAVLHRQLRASGGSPDPAAWRRDCDPLVHDALLRDGGGDTDTDTDTDTADAANIWTRTLGARLR